MPQWIDQSVPRPAGKDPTKMDPEMLDYLMSNDEQEAMRQQQMVEQLRGYGVEATPKMRLGQAAKPLEYASVLGSRLTSLGGQQAAKTSEAAALAELRRRLYPSDGGGAGMPADPSFQGVGGQPY